MEPLGLLSPGDPIAIEDGLAVTEALSNLIAVIGPKRDDNVASNLTLGTAVMVLDRFRASLKEHVMQVFPDDRQRAMLLYAASAAPPGSVDWWAWATTFSLSNPEKRLLADLDTARANVPGPAEAADRRMVYRYFNNIGEVGVDGVLLHLAEFLATHRPTPRPVEWGNLLDQVASPLLDAFFNHHDEQIAPTPLLTGDDLQRRFGLAPGPLIGQLLDQLLEEQAAGEITTQQEALLFVKRLIDQQS
jgi:hypothetical protein